MVQDGPEENINANATPVPTQLSRRATIGGKRTAQNQTNPSRRLLGCRPQD